MPISEELKNFFKSLSNGKHCNFTGLGNAHASIYQLNKDGRPVEVKGPRFINLGAAVSFLQALSSDPECSFSSELAPLVAATKNACPSKDVLKAQCVAAKKARAGIEELDKCSIAPDVIKAYIEALPAVVKKAAPSPKTKRAEVAGVSVSADKSPKVVKKRKESGEPSPPAKKAKEADKPASPKKPRAKKLADKLREDPVGDLEKALLEAVTMAQ